MGCGAQPGQGKASKEATPLGKAPAPAAAEKTAPEVPPRKLRAIRDAFAALDANHTGTIDAGELKTLLGRLGQDDLTEEDRDGIMKSIDADNGGKIELGEFVTWVLAREGCNDAIANWSLDRGLSDIHKAAIDGDADRIKLLVDAGHKVNAGDFNDVTPLHFACRLGKVPAAAALIEKNADLTARTSDTQRMPLHAAADHGSVELVQLLLASGAELDAKDAKNRTALHWACASSRESAAAALLKAGSDVNLKTHAGYTPYAFAQDWSTTALADLVKSYGGAR